MTIYRKGDDVSELKERASRDWQIRINKVNHPADRRKAGRGAHAEYPWTLVVNTETKEVTHDPKSGHHMKPLVQPYSGEVTREARKTPIDRAKHPKRVVAVGSFNPRREDNTGVTNG